ncbi:MAG TPA: A/G-specific adenine glycosylase [Chloroflexota bacterium]|nr:A/G-specific adenine glycosylase [Chloroflexota bacterium]
MKTDETAFQRQILDWYDAHRRDLPWRGERDPYRILVSEVMLQQTGVSRVLQKYPEFLARFPDVDALATALTADVLRAWEGLGYNRRALNLKRAAETIVREHGGKIPSDIAALETLPGLGRYTARAVACFAFDVQTPVVDTNVRRVLSGFAGRELSTRETEELAERLLPAGRASDWNQALMDYGALVYKAKPRRRPSSEGPFVTTNRFWRGRIIDALRRAHGLTLSDLVDVLPEQNRDETRVRGLVRALHEEGLVTYDIDSDSVRLPD